MHFLSKFFLDEQQNPFSLEKRMDMFQSILFYFYEIDGEC
ncbi:hypothetical protein BRO54_3031 [Geobacillus proteiniphilus]|uniref:Transcriptional regulator, TetR family n=1 Tax=Geobacillus proteiniphilus TaxID=860353 RepID=A0A1Q5SR95_9BACL|nr:hypothetical protein BRO54_3031 [Geobacillus proteiniphilus]